MEIIRTLLTASLASNSATARADSLSFMLKQASSAEWEQAVKELELHKVLPLIGYTIVRSGLQEVVPDNALRVLLASYKKTLLTNKLILTIAGRVIRSLREQGIDPTVFKGVVLADSFYPDPGTRAMADMDFLIRPGERELATRALKEVGFNYLPDSTEGDALCYGNHYGVLLDVHERFRLFDDKDFDNLTVDLKPRHIDLDKMRVWEPNAMLVHLVSHLESHRSEYGYRLAWLMDLGFLVQRWGPEFDWHKLRALVRNSEQALITVIRLLRFLEREFEVQIPATIASHGGTVRPLSLTSVLRGSRLAPWGLPGPSGWGRLLACGLSIVPRRNRSYPNLSDLFLWPVDFVSEHLIPGKFRG